MKRTILTLGLASIVAIAGCGKSEAPKKEEFYGDMVTAVIPGVEIRNELVLLDVDKDRQVDGIKGSGSVGLTFVADGYQDELKSRIDEYTQVMSPEMRDNATRVFQGVQDLGYNIAKSEFEASKR